MNKLTNLLPKYLHRISKYFYLPGSNFSLPFNKSKKRIKSDAKLNSGYLKVAGLFFSKKKCPTQANPYPTNGIAINKLYLLEYTAKNKITKSSPVPIKWSLRLVGF